MKILILIYLFLIKESKITRAHNFTLVKQQSRLYVRKYAFSQRTINVWNKLYNDCVQASTVLKPQFTQLGVRSLAYASRARQFKGALYIIWCGVNRLGDSGVNVV